MKAIQVLFGLILVLCVHSAKAQELNDKHTKVTIKTTLQCEICIERALESMKKHKGINAIEFNVETDELFIEYNGVKINDDELREMIADMGFDADDIEADEDSYNALPECCKKEE